MSIQEQIIAKSREYGLDPNTMLMLADIESGFRPDAANKSGATGVYQFMPGTWSAYGNGRSATDADANIDAGMRFTRDNIASFRSQMGRDPTPGEIYLMHQQGAGGAAKLRSNGNVPAADLVGAAAVTQNGGTAGMNAADFSNMWVQKGNAVYAKYAGGDGLITPVGGDTSPFSGYGQSPQSATDGLDPSKANVSIFDTLPQTPFTDAEKQRMEQEAAKNAPGFLSAAGASFRRDTWGGDRIYEFVSGEGINFDAKPGYVASKDEITKWSEGIPTQYIESGMFDEVVSPEHGEAIRKRALRALEDEQTLGRYDSPALRVGMNLIDPVQNLVTAAAIAAAPESAGGSLAVLGARGAKIAAGVGAGAAMGAADAAVRSQTDPLWQGGVRPWATSIGTGAAVGGALGGIASALYRNPKFQDEAGAMSKAAIAAVRSDPQSINAARFATDVMIHSDQSVLRRASAKANVDENTFRPFGVDWLRWDNAFFAKTGANPFKNLVGSRLVPDPVGASAKSGVIDEVSVFEDAALMRQTSNVAWNKQAQASFRSWAKANNKAMWKSTSKAEFNEEVSRYVRNTDPNIQFHPDVVAAGNKARAVFSNWLEQLRQPGMIDGEIMRPVRGADMVGNNPNYLPVMFDHLKVKAMIGKHGLDNIARVIGDSVRKNVANMTEQEAFKFAYAYLTKVRKLGAVGTDKFARGLGAEDLDELRQLLYDVDGVSSAEIDAIIAKMKPQQGEGASSYLRRRAPIDWNHSATVNGEPIKLSDMLENDIDVLISKYNQRAAGDVAFARLYIRNPEYDPAIADVPKYLVEGITSRGEFDTLLTKIKAVGADVGQTKKAIDADVARFEHFYNHIKGFPNHDEGSVFAQTLRTLGLYNYFRVMGQAGLAQIPEAMITVSSVGIKTMIDAVPGYRAFVRDARTGKLTDELSEEVENVIGTGTDFLNHNTNARVSDIDLPDNIAHIDDVFDQRIAKIIDTGNAAKRAFNVANGMTPVNTLLQRWTGRAIFIQFAKMAKEGKSLRSMSRMRAIGLDEAALDDIFAQINKFAKYDAKGKLQELGFAKWDNPEIADRFQLAVFKYARQTIMENDLGSTSMWMSSPLGRALMQFRSFMVGAYSKHLLRGMNHRDFETFSAFTGSMFAASLMYIARTNINSIGRSDRDKYLAEHLTPAKIAAGGFQASSFSTWLPMIMDQPYEMITGEPLFNSRTTGLGTGIVGNPTVDLLNKISALPKLAGDYSRGEATEGQIKQAIATIPFQNLLGFTTIFNMISAGLAQKS